MKTVRETKFHKILFEENTRTLQTLWDDDNADISEDEIRATITACAEAVANLRPRLYWANESNRKVSYTLNLQNWIAQTLAEKCEAVWLYKFAVLLPQEIIAQLSTEQTVEEAGKTKFQLKYFTNKQVALEWLNS